MVFHNITFYCILWSDLDENNYINIWKSYLPQTFEQYIIFKSFII